MREILRPFVALMLMLFCADIQAQDTSPALRAHRQNRKHHAQQQRLESSDRFEQAELQPYQPASPLIRHTRKGVRPVRIQTAPLDASARDLYLDVRISPRSTRESEEHRSE